MEGRPRAVTELAPEVPADLSRVIAKSLEKTPEARFQSAQEFHATLSGFSMERNSSSAATNILGARPLFETPAPRTLVPTEVAPRPDPTPTPAIPQTSTASRSWDPAILETARKNLAVFVGPMAKVLVNRAAKNARNISELYQALASEIGAPADREKFLRSRPP
jgi:serine/threonine-protein kinase